MMLYSFYFLISLHAPFQQAKRYLLLGNFTALIIASFLPAILFTFVESLKDKSCFHFCNNLIWVFASWIVRCKYWNITKFRTPSFPHYSTLEWITISTTAKHTKNFRIFIFISLIVISTFFNESGE